MDKSELEIEYRDMCVLKGKAFFNGVNALDLGVDHSDLKHRPAKSSLDWKQCLTEPFRVFYEA